MRAAIVFLLLIVATGFAVLSYSSWQQQDSFSCSSDSTTSLVRQVISKNIGRAVRDQEEKIRIDNIVFKLTDIITISDGKQAKRCQGMIAIPVPTSIPATETFSGLREVAHVQVEGRTLLVPITYEAKLTDNREKEYVAIDDVVSVITVLSELAKYVKDDSQNIDNQHKLAFEQRKEEPVVSTSPIISNSLVQLAPEQAATECSIERDILQIAARFRFDNENHVSDQQVEEFINSHLGELVNSYQIGEWNRLITVPGGPTSIEANVKVAAFFGKSAPLSRLQELAAGTGPNEPAEHAKCLARYATPVPSSMPKVSLK